MNNQSNKGGSSFLLQGGILAAAGIIVRLIGLIYRIPLTNTIGDSGMGVYSTAYAIYNILLLISSYSLPLAVSRLVSAKLSLGQYRNAHRTFVAALMFAAVVGTAMCAITFFGAEFFADTLMGMPQASYGIRALAPTILIMAFLGVLRGYFQGHSTMIPTAFSQIAEQIVNAVISVLAGYLLFRMGAGWDADRGTSGYYSAALGAAGGTIGTGAGALTAFLFCLFTYFAYRPRERKMMSRDRHQNLESYQTLTRTIVLTIVPVLVSSTVYQISSLVDQGIFAQYMHGTDYSVIWGVFSNKYNLMIHVPTAIASALASSVIPALSAAVARKNRDEAVRKSATAIRFSMLIAFPSTVGLAALATPIMQLLFRGNTADAARMMLVGSSAVLFYSLSTITNSILQGIGNIWIPVRNAVLSLALHIVLLAVMLWGFRMGIYGVLFANIFFSFLMCIFNNMSISRILNYRQEVKKTFLAPLFSSAVMGAATWLVYRLFHLLTHSNLLSTLIAILAAVIVYAAVLLLCGGVSEEDLQQFPKGQALISLAKRTHLLK